MSNAWILHIDGDGFFAYCEVSRFPHLRGKPVVVGEERGIACAMTYEAKTIGITRGMPIFKIREQFPEVTILPSNFELYEHYATKLFSLVEPNVHTLERYSIDECFALLHLPRSWRREEIHQWLWHLKLYVQQHTGITYSFGIARTKVLAKVASKLQKPDGCTVLMPDEEVGALKKTAIEHIWGIGRGLSKTLHAHRIKTAFDFISREEHEITTQFTTPVQTLWYELRGISLLPVGTGERLPKSLQSTKSFVPFSTDKTYLFAELLQNLDIVCKRMRSYGVHTDALSMFLKTTTYRYHSYFLELPFYTNNPLDIATVLRRAIDTVFQTTVRYKSTGITVWNLQSSGNIPLDLFGAQRKKIEDGKIMETIDQIRARFGHTSIGILATLPSTLDRTKKQTMRAQKDPYIYGLPFPYLGEVN